MEESEKDKPEAAPPVDAQTTPPKVPAPESGEAAEPLDMEDSLRHSLADNRFMGIRHHHVMRDPDELISFRNLLMRWHHNSFYIVSYCAGLVDPEKDEDGKYKHSLRLRVAKRIAAKTIPIDVDETDKDAIKNRREMVVTLANCKQDKSLKTFPLFCKMFNLLYFDVAEVEAMERRFPEILLTDPRIQNQDPLYTTTEENIDRIAPLALYYWHCIHGSFDGAVDYIDETLDAMDLWRITKDRKSRNTGWKLNDGIHFPGRRWKKYLQLPAENLSPTLPFEMPKKFKRSRNNDIREYEPFAKQLENLGIDNEKNRAKIVACLFPQLNHGEIGRLFPASAKAKRSKETDRDHGRWLLDLH